MLSVTGTVLGVWEGDPLFSWLLTGCSSYLVLYGHMYNGSVPLIDRVSIWGSFMETLLDERNEAVKNPSPFSVHFVYYAAKIFQRAGNSGDQEKLKVLKLKLMALQNRWMVAGISSPISSD